MDVSMAWLIYIMDDGREYGDHNNIMTLSNSSEQNCDLICAEYEIKWMISGFQVKTDDLKGLLLGQWEKQQPAR